MKAVSLIIFVFVCKIAVAQNKNEVYIYSSTLSSGQIKLLEYPNSKINVHESMQGSDTSERHTRECLTKVGFTQEGVLLDRTFILTFDKPINSFEFSRPKSSLVTIIPEKNKMEYRIWINKLDTTDFSFIIYSNECIHFKFYEVSKKIKLNNF